MKKFALLILILVFASCAASQSVNEFPAPVTPNFAAPLEPLFLIPLTEEDAAGLQKPDGAWLPLNAEFDVKCEGPFCQVKARIRCDEEVGLCRLIYHLPRPSAVTDFVLTCGKRKLRAIALPPEQIRRVTTAAAEQGLACQVLKIDELQRMLLVLRGQEGLGLQIDFRYVFAARQEAGKWLWSLPKVQGLKTPAKLDLSGAERQAGDSLCFSAKASAAKLIWRDSRGRGLSWDEHGLHLIEAPKSAALLPAIAEPLSVALRASQDPSSVEAYQLGLLLRETGAVFVHP